MHSAKLRKAILNATALVSLGAFGVPTHVFAFALAAHDGKPNAARDDAKPDAANGKSATADAPAAEVDGAIKNLQGVHVVAPRTSAQVARDTQKDAPNLIDIRTEEQI